MRRGARSILGPAAHEEGGMGAAPRAGGAPEPGARVVRRTPTWEGVSFAMSNFRKALIAGIAAAALGASIFAGLAPIASRASSHREAPLTAADPQIDNTDLYAFRSPDKPNSISFVSSWIPFEEPAGGPNFYLFAEHTNYDINIDNDGDARADIVYRWTFKTHYRSGSTFLYATGAVTSLNDPNLNIYQTYDLTRIRNGNSVVLIHNAKVAPSNVGAGSMPNYNSDLFDAAVTTTGAGIRSWVGQSDDAFFLDLRVFDLLYGGDFSEAGDDTLTGFNVNTMALSVPRAQLRGPNDAVIGIWNTASRPSMRVQHTDGTQTFTGWLQGLLQRLEAEGRCSVPSRGERSRVAASVERGVPRRVPHGVGLEPEQGRDPAVGSGVGLPEGTRRAQQAHQPDPVRDAPAEHGHAALWHGRCARVQPPRRARRGRPRVPERSPAVGRHDRHRPSRGDGGPIADPRRCGGHAG
ncbi:MAG: DUF4331 domain-containing protein [Actinobacteria bacterium]|nr:MAG: DUF4331 domain-containing protein [Actinomycetota bacterium]